MRAKLVIALSTFCASLVLQSCSPQMQSESKLRDAIASSNAIPAAEIDAVFHDPKKDFASISINHTYTGNESKLLALQLVQHAFDDPTIKQVNVYWGDHITVIAITRSQMEQFLQLKNATAQQVESMATMNQIQTPKAPAINKGKSSKSK